MDAQSLSTLKRQQPFPLVSREVHGGSCSVQLTQSRLRVYVATPDHSDYSELREQILTCLVAEYGLDVRMTVSLNRGAQREDLEWFDLEMQGTLAKVQSGLAFLESLTVKLVGKPNPGGDSWHC